jgi:hypothetical protein
MLYNSRLHTLRTSACVQEERLALFHIIQHLVHVTMREENATSEKVMYWFSRHLDHSVQKDLINLATAEST